MRPVVRRARSPQHIPDVSRLAQHQQGERKARPYTNKPLLGLNQYTNQMCQSKVHPDQPASQRASHTAAAAFHFHLECERSWCCPALPCPVSARPLFTFRRSASLHHGVAASRRRCVTASLRHGESPASRPSGCSSTRPPSRRPARSFVRLDRRQQTANAAAGRKKRRNRGRGGGG